MRARNLKPGFFKNEVLAELDPLARILFSGLWCMADREGRLEYRVKRIKAELLPYDNVNVEKLLISLSKEFITIYEVDENKYIQINKFKEHQNPHIKEAASSIPAPDKHSTSTVQAQDEYGSSPADSLFLDSLFLDSLNPITDSPLLNPVIASSDENHSPPVPFILIPLNDKTEFSVFTPMIDEWRNLFPKVDVEQELRNIRAWNLSDPKRRKTRSGVVKHITQWLAKEQNRGGNDNGSGKAKLYPGQKHDIRTTREREVDAECERLAQEYRKIADTPAVNTA